MDLIGFGKIYMRPSSHVGVHQTFNREPSSTQQLTNHDSKPTIGQLRCMLLKLTSVSTDPFVIRCLPCMPVVVVVVFLRQRPCSLPLHCLFCVFFDAVFPFTSALSLNVCQFYLLASSSSSLLSYACLFAFSSLSRHYRPYHDPHWQSHHGGPILNQCSSPTWSICKLE